MTHAFDTAHQPCALSPDRSSCRVIRFARRSSSPKSYLEDPAQFNAVRNMLGFTGTYQGTPVSSWGYASVHLLLLPTS